MKLGIGDIMPNRERQWNIMHVIAGLILMLCTIAGVSLSFIWDASAEVAKIQDRVEENTNSNKVILNEINVLSGKVDGEHDTEEDQFSNIDHRLTRVETSLGIHDGNGN